MKQNLTANAQLVRRTWNVRSRHGIAEKVAAPFQLEVRLNFQTHFLDAQVMALPRSENESMRTEADGSLIRVNGFVEDAQPAHDD